MGGEISQINQLTDVLELTDNIINKKYLSDLTNAEKYTLKDLQLNNLALNISKHCRIYHLKKFVYDKDENFLSKLTTVVNVAYALKGTIITSIQSDGDSINFYIGIVAKQGKGVGGNQNREALLNAFSGTVSGNFSGIEIGEAIKDDKLDAFMKSLDGNSICSVSVVPSIRNDDKGNINSYIQGIENLVDSLKGKKYTLLTIADPVSPSDILEIRHGFENIYNYLLPLYKIVETKGTTQSTNISTTDTESYVKGITEGITRSQSNSESSGYSNGFNMGASLILSAGFNRSKNSSTSNTNTFGSTNLTSEQVSNSQAKTHGVGHTTSDSTQVFFENRIIKSMLDKIENNIVRVEECEGYGAFNSATYIIADDKETALNVSGNFASLMKGEGSSAQISAINCWDKAELESVKQEITKLNYRTFESMEKYLKTFTHPVFKVDGGVEVSTSSIVSGNELAVQLGFPKKSVNGLTVMPMHRFGRNIIETGNKSINIGNLYFMGQDEKNSVTLDINSLASHTFVTGSTGTGKSNVVYNIVDKLDKQNVKFMIIEPAKGEYKNVFGNRGDVRVLGTNNKKNDLLKINPFSFNNDVHILEHIDRLVEIFNVCWPMYAAMPAVLKEGIEEAYISCGWDLDTSENRYYTNLFPTFADLQISLEVVIERSAYADESKSNYKGSLLTRVRSLTNGLNGKIFVCDEISEVELFDRNTIVDLSRVGSMETKALIMGILVMKLQEYRMSVGGNNLELKHITVLEEAHNLLKRTSTEQNTESSNVLGKSVEMISNAIAEMRTYGEGFIIADQSPSLLDMSVIRNTNTKIILRTPEYTDRLLVGKAAGLNEGQIEEIAKIPLGVAAVYQNNWFEPVLCKFQQFEANEKYVYNKVDEVTENYVNVKNELIKWLLAGRISDNIDVDLELIENNIEKLNIPTKRKLLIKKNLELKNNRDLKYAWEDYKFGMLAEMVVEVLDCKNEIVSACSMAKTEEQLNDILLDLQKYYLCESNAKSIELEISHCCMKVYSNNGDNELKRYYDWDYYVRNKFM